MKRILNGFCWLIFKNKYKAFVNISYSDNKEVEYPDWDVSKMSFNLLDIRQKRLVHLPRKDMRTIKVRGYLMDFELTAPVELLELGYFAGFGEKNSSLGFGCVEIL